MADMNVTVEIKLEVAPWGHVSVESHYAHPDRDVDRSEKPDLATPVLPLTSSVITPGYARAL